MLKVISDNKLLETKLIQFSDGATSVVIKKLPDKLPNHISVSVDPVLGSKSLDVILQTLEVLGTQYLYEPLNITLMLPYLPYARADRAFEEGQADQLNWFMQTIQAHDCKFHFICEDVHNLKAAKATLYRNNSLSETDQLGCLLNHLQMTGATLGHVDAVIAPDKGSVEKARSIAEHLKVPLLIATKERDPATGRIMAIEPPQGLESGKTYLIPDDLIDAGGTVCALTSKMPVGSKKIVYATHGIFPKGLAQFMWVDKLLVKNIIGDYITRQDLNNFNSKESN